MFSTNVVDRGLPRRVSFRNMEVGQIGRITRTVNSAYLGDLVLRGFDIVVSLTTAGRNWSSNMPNIEVELLPVGSTVTLTVTD